MAEKGILIAWLRDAHAMESATIGNLEKQADGASDYPGLKARYLEHMEVSKRQLERLDRCLDRLNADKSALKEAFTKFTSTMQSWMASVAKDAVLKNAISACAFVQFEISSYRVLIGAAEHYGEPDIRLLCQESLAEEEVMAEWLEVNLPRLTHEYLDRTTAGEVRRAAG